MQVVLPKRVHTVFIIIVFIIMRNVLVISVALVRYDATPPFALQDIDAASVYHDDV